MKIHALIPRTSALLVVLLCKSILLTESRIVQQCPLTNITWVKRGIEIGCKETRNDFYHCYRNNEGQLIEECRGFLLVTNTSGVCPYFKALNDLGYSSCFGGGCPNESDPSYFTYELYKYPSCLKTKVSSLEDSSKRFATASSKIQTVEPSEGPTQLSPQNKLFGSTSKKADLSQGVKLIINFVVSVVGVVVVNMLVIVVVCMCVRKRTAKLRLRNSALHKDEHRSHIYNSIQEIDILQAGNNEENESSI